MKEKEMKKMADEENRPDGEEQDVEATEEEEEKSCAKKSEADEISEDDLEKSLQKLTDFVEETDEPSRKEALLEKAKTEDLDKSEREELFDLMAPDSKEKDTLADEIEKSMEPEEEMQKAIDVSKYLEEQHSMVTKSMTGLADHIEKSDARQHEFNLLLAKGLADMGKMIKSIGDTIEVIGGQPARKPKSRQVQPIQKSFANQTPQEDQLSKSEILNTMSELVRKSFEADRGGMVNGVNMLNEAAKYESTGYISPAALKLVQAEKNNTAN